MFGIFNRIKHVGVSAVALALASLALAAWLHSQVTMFIAAVDRPTVERVLVLADDPTVRGSVGGLLQGAVDLAGGAPELEQLVATIESGPKLEGSEADTLTQALLTTRDRVLVQVDRPAGAPVQAVSVPVGPLIGALGIPVSGDTLQQMGVPATDGLELPLLPAQQVQTLLWNYTFAMLFARWGLILAGILLIVGLATSRRPVRALAILFGIAAAVAWVAPAALSAVQSWTADGGAGAWGAPLSPLLAAGDAFLKPWLLPSAIVATAATVLLAVAAVAVSRRRTARTARTAEA